MTHGSVGDEAHGMSKSISMGLILIICPSNENEIKDFQPAWHASDVSNLMPLHVKLLRYLDQATSLHFWVSIFRVKVNQGWVGKI